MSISKEQCNLLDKLNDMNMAESEYKRKKAEFDKIKDKCTHQYGSGESALVGGYFCTTCAICGWNDMGS